MMNRRSAIAALAALPAALVAHTEASAEEGVEPDYDEYGCVALKPDHLIPAASYIDMSHRYARLTDEWIDLANENAVLRAALARNMKVYDVLVHGGDRYWLIGDGSLVKIAGDLGLTPGVHPVVPTGAFPRD